MAKTKLTTVDSATSGSEYKYTHEEWLELDRLMHTVINDWSRLVWFYDLYKKYVDGGAPMPNPGCGTCALSIETYFNTFRVWFNTNGNLFSPQ